MVNPLRHRFELCLKFLNQTVRRSSKCAPVLTTALTQNLEQFGGRTKKSVGLVRYQEPGRLSILILLRMPLKYSK